MSKSQPRTDDVFFTVAQLNYLETLFPHVVLGATASESAMRHYFGQQAVIEAVRSRTRGLNARTVRVGADSIPTPR